jgi:oligosaccharyltransferase complex subunit alpha (ribophorin I)
LTTQRVLHSTKLVIKNDGRSKENTITLCWPTSLLPHAATVEIGQLKDGEERPAKLIPKGELAPSTATPAASCADFTLAEPLAKGASAKIVVEAVYTKILHARPAEIRQGDFQRMVFSADNAYTLSPYKILKDSTKINVVEGVESQNAPSPVDVAKKLLTLGPYSNVAPYTTASLEVHYKNAFPFLEAGSVVREIAISHWGNVYFEELYDISHNGAKIVGEWSRLSTMTSEEATIGSAPQLPAIIPPQSRWIYFRDDIGNISTSRLRPTQQGVQVVLVPRFPLFGGWRSKFIFGYSLPLTETVVKDTTTGRYALISSAKPSVKDVVVEDLTVRVILPEGAYDPKIESVLAYTLTTEKQYTYFDVLGRNVLVLKMKNVAPENAAGLAISYKFTSSALLLKPAVLSGGLLVIILIIIGLTGAEKAANGGKKIKAN